MLKNFVNFANSASAFYKSDVQANIKYIKDQMDELYGSDDENFFVYIQTEDNVRFSWYVWLTLEYIVASVEKVNLINPGWSYFFVKNFAPKEGDDYAFITKGVSGPGISKDVSSILSTTIKNYEPDEDACSCDDISIVNIGNTLINYYGIPWNTVCDATGVTSATVFTSNGLWGNFQFKKCFYTLFVS